MAEVFEAIAEFIKSACLAAKGNRYFQALAKIEPFEGGLRRKLRLLRAELLELAAKIAAKCGNGHIVANIEGRKLLCKIIPVCGGEHPFCKIIRKALSKEVVSPESLKGMVKN